MKKHGWIGVDLDGTLAFYDGWKGVDHIGDPIPKMADRVRDWLKEGKEVRIFTARACNQDGDRAQVVAAIDAWCERHFGQKLTVTATKDYGMIELWDDRAVQVKENTGVRADGRA